MVRHAADVSRQLMMIRSSTALISAPPSPHGSIKPIVLWPGRSCTQLHALPYRRANGQGDVQEVGRKADRSSR